MSHAFDAPAPAIRASAGALACLRRLIERGAGVAHVPHRARPGHELIELRSEAALRSLRRFCSERIDLPFVASGD